MRRRLVKIRRKYDNYGVNYVGKTFYDIDTEGQCYKTFYGLKLQFFLWARVLAPAFPA